MKLIVEMEMPKDCPMCPMAHYNKIDEFTGCEVAPFKRYAVKTDKAYAESDCRPDWCHIKGELVRCGECEYHGEPHRTDMGVDVVWCNFYNMHKLKDGYCNCGERKDGAV